MRNKIDEVVCEEGGGPSEKDDMRSLPGVLSDSQA